MAYDLSMIYKLYVIEYMTTFFLKHTIELY